MPPNRGIASRGVLLTSLLLPEIILTRIVGNDPTARTSLAVQAASQIMLMSMVGLLLFAQTIGSDRGEPSNFTVKMPRVLAMGLATLLLADLVAVFIGLSRSMPLSFIVGDAYKLVAFALMFLLIFAGMASQQTRRKAITTTFYLVLISEAVYAGLYLLHVVPLHVRPQAVYLAIWLPALLYCLHKANAVSKKVAITLWTLVVMTFGVISWFSQSLTLVAIGSILFFGTMFFHRPKRFSYLAIASVLCISTSATVIAVVGGDVSDQGAAAITNQGYYLTRKFGSISQYGISARTLELIGGDRLAQMVAVVRHWRDNPIDMVIGEGMGGEIHVESVTGVSTVNWKLDNHYIEAGYPEVMLRTGLIGLAAYLAIIWQLFRIARQNSKDNVFAALGASYFLYVGIFSLFNEPLLGMGTASLFMIAFVATISLVDSNPFTVELSDAIESEADVMPVC